MENSRKFSKPPGKTNLRKNRDFYANMFSTKMIYRFFGETKNKITVHTIYIIMFYRT